MTPRTMPRSSSAIWRSISLLPRRQRHGEDGVRTGGPYRRGGQQVREGSDRVLGHERRGLAEDDGVVDRVGRARGQESGREQVALAGCRQSRSLEDVDVLVDHLAHEHQGVVIYDRQGPVGRLLQLFDDPLRHRGGTGRPGLDIAAELGRHVVADHEGECEHGNDRDGHEGQE